MAEFNFEEYADIIYVYGFTDGNESEAVREYERRFPNRRVPDRRVFSRTFRRLRESGTVAHNRIERRTATSTSADMNQRIIAIVRANPDLSIRRVAARLEVSTMRVWRVLHREGLYPYHHIPVHGLQEGDAERRLEFCSWMMERDLDDSRFIKRILWTDESQFTRDGITNFHNVHTWAEENPHVKQETSFQQRFSVNVWAGIVGNTLVGPYILPQILNGEIYKEFLEETLPELLEEIPLNVRQSMYYQHDGAPAHSTTRVKELLNSKYPERWIGRNGPISWPARSPDLSPLDFYFWGVMKEDVYSRPINNRAELITRIGEAAIRIRERMSTTDLPNGIRRRLFYCILNDGGHSEHLLS